MGCDWIGIRLRLTFLVIGFIDFTFNLPFFTYFTLLTLLTLPYLPFYLTLLTLLSYFPYIRIYIICRLTVDVNLTCKPMLFAGWAAPTQLTSFFFITYLFIYK